MRLLKTVIYCSMSLVMFACVSCGSKDKGVVLIDPDKAVEAVLEDVASDIRIIPLKSDRPIPGITMYFFYDDYFFGTKVEPDMYTDLIFKNLSVFDSEGNYLGLIDRLGRGHDEYLGLRNFMYFEDEHMLSLYSSDRMNCTKYSYKLPDMEYLGSQPSFFMVGLDQSVHMGDGRTLVQTFRGDDTKRDLMMAIFRPDTVLMATNYGEFAGNRVSATFYQHKFTNYRNPLLAFFGYNNEIYSIDDNDSLKLEFSFTFGNKGLPKSYTDDPNHPGPYIVSPMQYMEDGSYILFYVPVKNGNLISFIYSRPQYDNVEGFMHYYVTNGSRSANYSDLKIPGLKFEPTLVGVNGTSYVFQMTSTPEIDESVPMSRLGQQILDAFKAQNDDNPILLQFRFKDLD